MMKVGKQKTMKIAPMESQSGKLCGLRDYVRLDNLEAVLVELEVLEKSKGGALSAKSMGMALCEAVLLGRPAMVEALWARTSGVDLANGAGNTALWMAAERGQAACLEKFIVAGWSVDARLVDSRTPLMMAAGNGRSECVEMLLAAGCDTEANGPDGRRADQGAWGREIALSIVAERERRELDREAKVGYGLGSSVRL